MKNEDEETLTVHEKKWEPSVKNIALAYAEWTKSTVQILDDASHSFRRPVQTLPRPIYLGAVEQQKAKAEPPSRL
ncbi:MAG: hypothetical protein QXI76_00975 [Thermofilum sp.]